MQYLVEYIDPKITSDDETRHYCYVEADSESRAIEAANEANGDIPLLSVQNAIATALREDCGETFEAEEFAALAEKGWHRA